MGDIFRIEGAKVQSKKYAFDISLGITFIGHSHENFVEEIFCDEDIDISGNYFWSAGNWMPYDYYADWCNVTVRVPPRRNFLMAFEDGFEGDEAFVQVAVEGKTYQK